MSSPVLMSPSVLNADLTRLREEVERIAGVSDLIHLDVMDGHFVPNLTFGLTVIEPLLRDERFRSSRSRGSMTVSPKVRLGTKWPSITSR